MDEKQLIEKGEKIREQSSIVTCTKIQAKAMDKGMCIFFHKDEKPVACTIDGIQWDNCGLQGELLEMVEDLYEKLKHNMQEKLKKERDKFDEMMKNL